MAQLALLALECIGIVVTGYYGWFVLRGEISARDGTSSGRSFLTKRGKNARRIMLGALALSLVTAFVRQRVHEGESRMAAETRTTLLAEVEMARRSLGDLKEGNESLLAQLKEVKDQRDKLGNESRALRVELQRAREEQRALAELSVPIRKLVFRVVYKTEQPTVTSEIEVWRMVSGFNLLRKIVLVRPGPYGSPEGFSLRAGEDATFTKGDGHFTATMGDGDPIEERLPTQYSVTPLLRAVETRAVVGEGIHVRDLQASSLGIRFRSGETSKTAADVLEQISRVHVYASVSDEKVICATFDIDRQSAFVELLREAALSGEEKLTQGEGFAFYTHSLGSVGYYSYAGPQTHVFEVESAKDVLDELPDW